ncbi:MAG: putative quinol monooxygenase [Pseudomonadota bacterium]
MTGERIHLNGHIDVPEQQRDAVAAALPEHIALTHAEPGCISFEVTPDPTMPGRYHVAEIFIDQAAFDAHQARAAASPWAEITKDVARDYKITKGD